MGSEMCIRDRFVSDVEADEFQISIHTSPARGSASVSGSVLEYVPAQDYSGDDLFYVHAYDGQAYSAPEPISITITEVPDAPVASDIEALVSEDGSVAITFDASDIDSDELSYSIEAGPSNGAVAMIDTASGTAEYTPSADYFGDDSFTYQVSDGELSSTGLVSVSVEPVNDSPVISAAPDALSLIHI